MIMSLTRGPNLVMSRATDSLKITHDNIYPLHRTISGVNIGIFKNIKHVLCYTSCT